MSVSPSTNDVESGRARPIAGSKTPKRAGFCRGKSKSRDKESNTDSERPNLHMLRVEKEASKQASDCREGELSKKVVPMTRKKKPRLARPARNSSDPIHKELLNGSDSSRDA